jgi:hypothetical protein
MNTLITRRTFVGYAVSTGALNVMSNLLGPAAAQNPDPTQKLVLNRFFIQVPAATLARMADRVRSTHFPGGDYGAVVADWLAIDTPDHVIGRSCRLKHEKRLLDGSINLHS